MPLYSINDDIVKYDYIIKRLKSLKALSELASKQEGEIKLEDIDTISRDVGNFATLNNIEINQDSLETIKNRELIKKSNFNPSEFAGLDFINGLLVEEIDVNQLQIDLLVDYLNKLNLQLNLDNNTLNLEPTTTEALTPQEELKKILTPDVINFIIEKVSHVKENLKTTQKQNNIEQQEVIDELTNSRLKFSTNKKDANIALLKQLVKVGFSNDNKSTSDPFNLLNIQSFKNITKQDLEEINKQISKDTTISKQQKGILMQNLDLIKKVKEKVDRNGFNDTTQNYILEIQKKYKYNTGLSDLIIKSNSKLIDALKPLPLEQVFEDKEGKVSNINWKNVKRINVDGMKVKISTLQDTLKNMLKPQTIKTKYIFDKPMMATEVLHHASNLKKVLKSNDAIRELHKSPNIVTSLYYIRDNVFGNLKSDIDNSVVAQERKALDELIDYTQKNNLSYHINNLRSAKTQKAIEGAVINMPDYLKNYINNHLISFNGKHNNEIITELSNNHKRKNDLCKKLENNIKKIINTNPDINLKDAEAKNDIRTILGNILGNSVMNSAKSKTKEALRENQINNIKATLLTVYNAVVGIVRTAMTVFGGMKLFEVSQAQIQQESNQFRTNSNSTDSSVITEGPNPDPGSVITEGPNPDPGSVITEGPNPDPGSVITEGPNPELLNIGGGNEITNPNINSALQSPFISPAQTSYTLGSNLNAPPVVSFNLSDVRDVKKKEFQGMRLSNSFTGNKGDTVYSSPNNTVFTPNKVVLEDKDPNGKKADNEVMRI